MSGEYMHHSLNDSLSKQAACFAKSKRFLPQLQSKSVDVFYDIPSGRTLKSCSFGIGDKVSYVYNSCAPSPTTYDVAEKLDKKTGFSFGAGRNEVQFGSFISRRKSQSPGPLSYSLPSALNKKTFSFGEKLGSSFVKLSECPGPGRYDTEQTDLKNSGKYMLSNYKNDSTPIFHPKGEGLKGRKNWESNVGPGQHQPDNLSPLNNYSQAKYQGSQVRSFGRAKRFSTKQNKILLVPGPGQYEQFSQFGQIQPPKYSKKSRN